MKKMVSLFLAIVMCLSLAACGGGPDKQPAIDAYNKAANAVNEMIELINQAPDAYADFIDDLNQVIDDLNGIADALENDDLDQAALDQMVTECQALEQAAKETVEVMKN